MIEKINNTTELTVGEEYLLFFKDDNISVYTLYIGCAVGQYTIEEDMFGENYNLVLPDRTINNAYNYSQQYPCTGDISENQIQILFFRSRVQNTEEESEWSFDVVYSKNTNISSTIDKYQIYKVSNIETIDDIKCYWEHSNNELMKHIFDTLVMSAEEAELYSKQTIYGHHSITDAVKSGIFTSQIIKSVDNNPIVNLDRINQQAIQGWYQLANKLSGILYIEGQTYWCVYRFIYNIDIILNDKIIHPLPFSSTYNLDWVRREWGAANRCCLLRILIPFKAPMVVIEPPDRPVYMDRNSQYEIVLPAGILHKQSINKDTTNLIVGSYILEPWSYEQCIEYINHYNTNNY